MFRHHRLTLLPLPLSGVQFWHWKSCYEMENGMLETVGRLLDNSEAEAFFAQGLTAVLDLTAEYSECERFRDLKFAAPIELQNVPILDLTLPTDMQITEAVEFVRRHAKNGKVFIHCALGCCRAPSIAAGYLLASGHADSGEEAIALVRRAGRKLPSPRALPS